jgi:ectoine hydroxylase-related dioxygenase (phytanoyl-CoA dioxygenase family)
MTTKGHPTTAERFFFDNNGYLVLDNFLSPERVSALYKALEQVVERRRSAEFKREHAPAFDDRLDGANLTGLPEDKRRFFHGFAFDPPEYRWG